MDLDVQDIKVHILSDIVMEILNAKSFHLDLKSYSINKIIPLDIAKAKQTETMQRFKIHLITSAGEALFTKIEFSRRGIIEGVFVQSVSDNILRLYRLPPLLIPHYNIQSAVIQKISAVSSRSVIQARDILDLYLLSSQWEDIELKLGDAWKDRFKKARENVFEVTFEQFRDTVLPYLTDENINVYKTASNWDEVRLKTANFIDELRKRYA